MIRNTPPDTLYHCFVCNAKIKHHRNHGQNRKKVKPFHTRSPTDILCLNHSFIRTHHYKIIEVTSYNNLGFITETITGENISSHLISIKP